MATGGILPSSGSTSLRFEAALLQAAYFLERLGALRLDAEISRAGLYIDLQKISGIRDTARASDLRGIRNAPSFLTRQLR
jgi:hypothetical protein